MKLSLIDRILIIKYHMPLQEQDGYHMVKKTLQLSYQTPNATNVMSKKARFFSYLANTATFAKNVLRQVSSNTTALSAKNE